MNTLNRSIMPAMMALAFLAATPGWATIVLQNATAQQQRTDLGGVSQTIDGNLTSGNGMGFTGTGGAQGAYDVVWETQTDVTGAGTFTFTIPQNLATANTMARFRLSVTDADRSLFADGNPPNGSETPRGDVAVAPSTWTLLNPVLVTSSGGATMTVGANGEVKVAGTNPATDTYTITARSPLGKVTGIRLEVMPGSTGSARVGRGTGGDAIITEFQAAFAAGGSLDRSAKYKVNLSNATASFEQTGLPAAEAIDGFKFNIGADNNGWAVSGATAGSNPTAVFQTATPLTTSELAFELYFTYPTSGHKIGDLRLAYTTDASPTLGSTWVQLAPQILETFRDDSSLSIDGSNIISVSGSTAMSDVYQVVANLGQIVDGITGFRLEANPKGDAMGFGAGNFVLVEFEVFASQIPEPGTILLLACGGWLLVRVRKKSGKWKAES